MKMNIDILHKVAEFVEPDPTAYWQLAMVSRDFYYVFTSDKLWRQINPYVCDSQIYYSFLSSLSTQDEAIMASMWNKSAEQSVAPHTDNLYAWLGWLIHTKSSDQMPPISRNLLSCAVNLNGHAIQWVPEPLQRDFDLALEAVKTHGCALKHLNYKFQNDKDIVMAAVARPCPSNCPVHETRGCALEFVSEHLRADRDVVLRSVAVTATSLIYAHPRLKSDREIVEIATTQDGWVLGQTKFTGDRDIALKAMTNYNEALRFTPKFQDDFEVVMTALKCDGCALQYASPRLRNDRDVVLRAVTNNGRALEFASKSLQNDPQIVLRAVSSNGLALRFASDAVKNIASVVLAAVSTNGEALWFASHSLKADRDIVSAAIDQTGRALQYASSKLQRDNDFIMKAVLQNSIPTF